VGHLARCAGTVANDPSRTGALDLPRCCHFRSIERQVHSLSSPCPYASCHTAQLNRQPDCDANPDASTIELANQADIIATQLTSLKDKTPLMDVSIRLCGLSPT